MSVATLTIQRVARGFIGRMRAMRIKEVHIHTVQVAERREKENVVGLKEQQTKSLIMLENISARKRRRDNLKRKQHKRCRH